MTSPTPSEPRTGPQLYHAAPFTLAATAGLTGAAIATIYITQIVLSSLGVAGLVASMVANALVLVVLFRYAHVHELRLADFGVRRVSARFIAAAVLLGISMWYLTALLVVLIDPPGDTTKLQQFVDQTPLAPTLLALTIFPAVAEELVFRGVLARGLAKRIGTFPAILISAAVFGLYHVFPPQIVSTFALGIVLGFLTLRSRSVVPAMIVHTLNNTIAVLLSRHEIPAASDLLESYPLGFFVVAIGCVACGLALSTKGAA
jgi:membrane protease YdiL (CAAX protease family)